MVRILRVTAVLAVRGKARSSHYEDIAAGLYTPPVKIGERASGWPEDEVAALQQATIAGKSSKEIRSIVRQLTARRAGAAQDLPA